MIDNNEFKNELKDGLSYAKNEIGVDIYFYGCNITKPDSLLYDDFTTVAKFDHYLIDSLYNFHLGNDLYREYIGDYYKTIISIIRDRKINKIID